MKRESAKRDHWRTGALVAVLVATSLFRVVPAQVPAAGPAAGGIGVTSSGDGALRRRVHRSSAHDGCGVWNPAEGRECVRRGGGGAPRRRRARAGSLQSRWRSAGARVSEEGSEGHIGCRTGLGAARGGRGLVPLAPEEPPGRGARSGRRAGGAACRAHGARTMGHDEF